MAIAESYRKQVAPLIRTVPFVAAVQPTSPAHRGFDCSAGLRVRSRLATWTCLPSKS